MLWPPNGKLTSIEAVTTIEDNCDTAPTITAIGADSPRAVPTDVAVTPAGISVRAFRAGNETQGRTYTLRYVVSDDAGNSVPATTTVHVPHDQR